MGRGPSPASRKGSARPGELRGHPARPLVPPRRGNPSGGTAARVAGMVTIQGIGTIRSQAPNGSHAYGEGSETDVPVGSALRSRA